MSKLSTIDQQAKESYNYLIDRTNGKILRKHYYNIGQAEIARIDRLAKVASKIAAERVTIYGKNYDTYILSHSKQMAELETELEPWAVENYPGVNAPSRLLNSYRKSLKTEADKKEDDKNDEVDPPQEKTEPSETIDEASKDILQRLQDILDIINESEDSNLIRNAASMLERNLKDMRTPARKTGQPVKANENGKIAIAM